LKGNSEKLLSADGYSHSRRFLKGTSEKLLAADGYSQSGLFLTETSEKAFRSHASFSFRSSGMSDPSFRPPDDCEGGRSHSLAVPSPPELTGRIFVIPHCARPQTKNITGASRGHLLPALGGAQVSDAAVDARQLWLPHARGRGLHRVESASSDD
jgi:hypothetical protein